MAAELVPVEGGVVMTREYLDERMEVIRRVIAPKATPPQIEVFLHMCVVYDLDPFRGEIFLGPEGRPMTSRDGYRKIAKRNPSFIACRSGVVYENDTVEFEQEFVDGELIIKNFRHKREVFNRGKLIGAWAIGAMKDQPDDIKFAAFDQYKRGSKPWQTYPDAMIQKVAEVLVLRSVDEGCAGIYSEEEMMDTERPRIIDALVPPESAPPLPPGERDERKAAAEATLDPSQRTVNRVPEEDIPVTVTEVPNEPEPEPETQREKVAEATPEREPGTEFATEKRLKQLGTLSDKSPKIITGAYARFGAQLLEGGDNFKALATCFAKYVEASDFAGPLEEHRTGGKTHMAWFGADFDTYNKRYTAKGERAHLACVDVMQTVIYLLLDGPGQESMVDVYVEVATPYLDGFVQWMAATYVPTTAAVAEKDASGDTDDDIAFDPSVQARKEQAEAAAKVGPADLPDPSGGDAFDGLFD